MPLALRDGVHGRSEEEANGFVDVGFRGDGGEREFGEGFGDADDGFELADRDGDAGARVGGDFGRVDLSPDGDEVGRELFARFGGEAGRAASGGFFLLELLEGKREGALFLRFAVADVPLHLVDRNLGFYLFFHSSSSHLNAHHMTRYPLISSLLMLIAHDEDHIEAR